MMSQVQQSDVPYGPEGILWGEVLRAAMLADGTVPLITAPDRDPVEAYPTPDELDPKEFQVPPTGLSDEQRKSALGKLEKYLFRKRDHMLGYQANEDMNGYRQDLSRFMECHINNIGDPFKAGNFKPNSKVVEQAVLDYFAALWNAKWPHDPTAPDFAERYWGYVLTMGSTEGNMYALWSGRDYLQGKALITDPERRLRSIRPLPFQSPQLGDLSEQDERSRNAYRPVAFFSEDTHYSFTKAVRVLDIDTFHAIGEREYQGQCPLQGSGGVWPLEVPSKPGPSQHSSDGPGEIDVSKLHELVEFFAAKGHSILVSLNFGSTFKCAYDNVRQVCETLFPIFKKYGLLEREIQYSADWTDVRRGFWIHVDGALGAAYMPFLRMAEKNPVYEYRPEIPIPEFDFGLVVKDKQTQRSWDMVHSIVMSGHKWIGAPWPCGIFMTKVKYQLRPPDDPAYIGSPDTTFAGSRNGFSPVILWQFLAQNSYDRQISRACEAQRLTQYLEQQLHRLGKNINKDLYVARTPLALTVRFRRPNDEIIQKWSLSAESLLMDPGNPNSQRDYVHVFIMHSATPEKIDQLIKELHAPDAFPEKPATLPAAEPSPIPPQNVASVALVPHTGRGFQ
jgi:histidine decarboxylase